MYTKEDFKNTNDLMFRIEEQAKRIVFIEEEVKHGKYCYIFFEYITNIDDQSIYIHIDDGCGDRYTKAYPAYLFTATDDEIREYFVKEKIKREEEQRIKNTQLLQNEEERVKQKELAELTRLKEKYGE